MLDAPTPGVHSAAMRAQPLLSVHDVEAASGFYQRLLGVRSDHGGPEYERLVTPDGQLVLQLHSFAVEHHHGAIGDPADRPYGNGVLLWFEIEDFDAAVARVEELGAEIVLPPHRNPPEGDGGPNHRESGSATAMATASSWQAPTARPPQAATRELAAHRAAVVDSEVVYCRRDSDRYLAFVHAAGSDGDVRRRWFLLSRHGICPEPPLGRPAHPRRGLGTFGSPIQRICPAGGGRTRTG